jgi:replicative DNA helicase
MSIVEKTFLGSLMKAEYLLQDTVIQPEHLQSTRHKEIMRKMVELNQVGRNIDLITWTTLPNLESLGGMSYLSELLSYADVEKFDGTEKLILDLWKEREKRNILNVAAMNDWEIAKVIGELDKINQMKMDDHTSLTQALADIFEAPWGRSKDAKECNNGYQKVRRSNGRLSGGRSDDNRS